MPQPSFYPNFASLKIAAWPSGRRKRVVIQYLFFLIGFLFWMPFQSRSQNDKGVHHVKIRSLRFSGNKITKEPIILRELTIQEGDSLPVEFVESVLDFNKRRILNLQLFSKVDYCINYWDDNYIDIEYYLTEILYWLPSPIFQLADRNFNVWWVEENRRLDRTNIGLDIVRINFRGRNEKIGTTIQLGYNKYFDLEYVIPYIDKKLRHGLDLSVSYATGREINFLTDSNKLRFYSSEKYPYKILKAKIGTTYRKGYASIHELHLSYNRYEISDELHTLNPDFLANQQRKMKYLELYYKYLYNNTDTRVYPTSGLELKLSAVKRGLLFDRDVNQFFVYTEGAYYKKLFRNISSSLVFRGRFSFNHRQPYILDRAMGFRNEYVRGYEYFVIDGSHYAVLRGNLRYKIFDQVISQRLLPIMRFIPFRVYAKIFDDIGYVYKVETGNSFLNNRLLNGYGVGLDIIISYYAKFRLEYSLNHLGQKGLFLHGTKE